MSMNLDQSIGEKDTLTIQTNGPCHCCSDHSKPSCRYDLGFVQFVASGSATGYALSTHNAVVCTVVEVEASAQCNCKIHSLTVGKSETGSDIHVNDADDVVVYDNGSGSPDKSYQRNGSLDDAKTPPILDIFDDISPDTHTAVTISLARLLELSLIDDQDTTQVTLFVRNGEREAAISAVGSRGIGVCASRKFDKSSWDNYAAHLEAARKMAKENQ